MRERRRNKPRNKKQSVNRRKRRAIIRRRILVLSMLLFVFVIFGLIFSYTMLYDTVYHTYTVEVGESFDITELDKRGFGDITLMSDSDVVDTNVLGSYTVEVEK